ncbi:hypothetical protein Ana3638_23440 [Anaerocolumna sedimenticola]|uniref:Uncharacterized protein n=1 Tax=Anaerocolumna sedimenticola TaxID=2696063 RepID=A0A6P1TVB5_9FIRM|nr:pectate lyase-like adhesive domain-containing protein [Anaerocolumna sedimenticola]QHQ63365.1 hypothetical protein Ana3638_23440 [Anaerocolumna sedimenticola]
MKSLFSLFFKLVTSIVLIIVCLPPSFSFAYSDVFNNYFIADEMGSSDISSSDAATQAEEVITEAVKAEEVIKEGIPPESDIMEETQTEESLPDEIQMDETVTQEAVEIQTKEISADSAIPEVVAKAAVTADVYDQATFITALRDKTISIINITADFSLNYGNVIPDYTTYIRPNLVINGNGHIVDFTGFCPSFTVSEAYPMNITLYNIIIYGTNYYGPIMLTGARATVRFATKMLSIMGHKLQLLTMLTLLMPEISFVSR